LIVSKEACRQWLREGVEEWKDGAEYDIICDIIYFACSLLMSIPQTSLPISAVCLNSALVLCLISFNLLSFLSWLQIFLSRLKCVMDWQSVYLLGNQPAMSEDYVKDVCYQLCHSM
jgi:hypothetical protein